VLKTIPEKSVHCCVTSPPYFGLRSYCQDGTTEKALEVGTEQTPEEYVDNLVDVFREVKRVLRDDGTVWLNSGDSYSGGGRGGDPKHKKESNSAENTAPSYKGIPAKNLIGIPWKVAFALQADGWYLRQDIIWSKNNPMPESVTDRCTKSHEYVFLLSKSKKYYFDNEAIKEPAAYDGRKDTMMKGSTKYKDSVVPNKKEHTMATRWHERWQYDETGLPVRNKRSVWNINTKPYKGAHFACVDEETEVLTSTGWKSRETITMEDEIATFDILDEEIHYHKPYGIYEYDYDGELFHLQNQWVDQLVTPNHRVLLKYVHNSNNCRKHFDENWHYINAEDIKVHSGILIPNAGKYNGFLSIGEDKAALLGWIITDGHIRPNGSINIYQSLSANPLKVEQIENLLKKANINYTRSERFRPYNNGQSHEVTFSIPKTRNDLSWVFEWLNDDKTPKWELLHLIHNELKVLFDALIDGDGHRRKSDGRVSFIQKNEYTQLWFRPLACHLNLRTTIHEKRTRISSCMTSHVTDYNYSQIHQTDFKECITKEHYKGKVWCPNLPNTNFVAKRNNRIFITGNTFPAKLIEPCIKAGCPENGTVLDPFGGSGTVGEVCIRYNRNAILIELNPEYEQLIRKRISNVQSVLVM
jgi:DNA modification methylase